VSAEKQGRLSDAGFNRPRCGSTVMALVEVIQNLTPNDDAPEPTDAVADLLRAIAALGDRAFTCTELLAYSKKQQRAVSESACMWRWIWSWRGSLR